MEKNLTRRERKFFVTWLGIPEGECPPDHYRMLGLPTFECNEETIRSAVQHRRVLVHSRAKPEDSADARATQKFLLSVEQVLLDPEKKHAYDAKLKKLSPSPGKTGRSKRRKKSSAQAASQVTDTEHPRAGETPRDSGNVSAKQGPSPESQRAAATRSPSQPEPRALPRPDDSSRIDPATSSSQSEHSPSQRQLAAANDDPQSASQQHAGPANVTSEPRRKVSPWMVGLVVSNFALLGLMGAMFLYFIQSKSTTTPPDTSNPIALAELESQHEPGTAVAEPPGVEAGEPIADSIEPSPQETNPSLRMSASAEPRSNDSASEVPSGDSSNALPTNSLSDSALSPSAGDSSAGDSSAGGASAVGASAVGASAGDASAVGEQGVPQARDPQVMTEPFVELATEFNLPDIPTVSTESSESTSPGKIASHAIADVTLELDSSAADLSGLYEFAINEITTETGGMRRWQVLAAPSGNRPGEKSQLGLFLVDELNQLRFFWDMDRPFANTAQLANTLLVLNFAEFTHTIQLRGVQHQQRYRTQLLRTTLPIPLVVNDSPGQDKLALRIQGVRGVGAIKKPAAPSENSLNRSPRYGGPPGFDAEVSPAERAEIEGFDEDLDPGTGFQFAGGSSPSQPSQPSRSSEADDPAQPDRKATAEDRKWLMDIPVGGQSEMDVDKQGRVKLAIHFSGEDDQVYKLGVGAKAERREGGNLVKVTVKELQSDIRKQSILNVKFLNEYIQAMNNLGAARSQYPGAVARRDDLLRQARANPKSSAGLQRPLAQLSTQIADLERVIRNSTSTVKLKTKQIPTSYEAFAQKLAVARIIGDIHSRGELDFQLVAKAKHGIIRLLAADDQPEAIATEVIIPEFGVPGVWFRMNVGMFYNLQDDGGVTLKSAFTRTPDLRGFWNGQGDSVTVEIAGAQEQYKMHEDVMMKSSSGALYRMQ